MQLSRLLRPELILLEMETLDLPEEEREEIPKDRYALRQKEAILEELVALLDRGGRVGNKKKLAQDLLSREKKATTGLVRGLAIPHVRSIHAKEFMLGFARSTPGLEYGSMDGHPAHLFFILAAPPYDDTSYMRVYKSLAEGLSHESVRDELMEAGSEGEVIRTIKSMEQ